MTDRATHFDRDYVAEAATLLAHDEPFPGGAVVPPIYQTSLFTFDNYAEMADAFAGRRRQPIYSRGDNPTVHDFERRIAALEGAEAARGFSSGMAAISATVLAFVRRGRAHRRGAPLLWRRLPLVREAAAASRHQGRLCRRLRSGRGRGGAARRQAALSRKPHLDGVRAAGHRASDAGWPRRRASSPSIDNSWATPMFQKPITARRRSRAAFGLEISRRPQRHGRGRGRRLGRRIIARINELTHPFLGAKLSPLRGLAAAARAAHAAVAPAAPHEERA